MQAALASASKNSPTKDISVPVIIGVSYRNSTIEFREKLARSLNRNGWRAGFPAEEWAVVTTCNRTEFVLSTSDPEGARRHLSNWAEKRLGAAPFYVLEGRNAVAHLFRVASGLDSMEIMDGQILDQLRGAGKEARLSGSSRAVLPPLFDTAVNVGTRARRTTSNGAASVGKAAVKFARGKLGHEPAVVLLVGTGKMSRVAAGMLKESEIQVATRRPELPSAFSGFTPVSWGDIKRAITKAELIICATTSEGYVIREEDLTGTKTRVIMDLGFPRNVDPALRGKKGVFLYDLDDLAKRRRGRGPASAVEAERVVQSEAESFIRWLNASKLSPELSGIFRWAERLRLEETQNALRKLGKLTPKERALVQAMGKRITGKILAKPAAFAKLSTADLPQEERLRLLRAVFMEGS